jgi:serine/threonine protein kinase
VTHLTLAERETRPGRYIYQKPEWARSAETHPSIDIYAFGVICHQLLCGTLPSSEAIPNAGEKGILPSSWPTTQLPQDLIDICSCCLQFTQVITAVELANALERFRAGLPIGFLRERQSAFAVAEARSSGKQLAYLLTEVPTASRPEVLASFLATCFKELKQIDNALLSYCAETLLKRQMGDETEQLFDVTDGKNHCIIQAVDRTILSANDLPNDKRSPKQEREPGKGTPLSNVLALLEKGVKFDDLRKHIQKLIAPSAGDKLPVQLANSLNVWLRMQDPKDPKQQLTLKEKRAVTEIVELLGNVSQCQLMRRGEPCRFDVDVNATQPEGCFRVRAIGATQGSKRVRLSDLLDDAPFEFSERQHVEG